MIRKQGKLPGVLINQNYALEYGEATLEMQYSAQITGKSMILIDDLLATGGTFVAAKSLLEQCGAVVAACAATVSGVVSGVIASPFSHSSASVAPPFYVGVARGSCVGACFGCQAGFGSSSTPAS